MSLTKKAGLPCVGCLGFNYCCCCDWLNTIVPLVGKGWANKELMLCVRSTQITWSRKKQAMWTKNDAKGTSDSRLLTVGSFNLSIVKTIILIAFLTIVSLWLKNLQVTASNGKLLFLELVKNLIVVSSICRAIAFRKEMNVSTSSSSQKLNLKEISLFKKGWLKI